LVVIGAVYENVPLGVVTVRVTLKVRPLGLP
jgi:hypothetical protein